MSLSQRNLRGVSIDLKLNNSDLIGNTTELKRTHASLRAGPQMEGNSGSARKTLYIVKCPFL